MVKKSHDGGKNMNCKKCGNLCNDNDVYCINCGNPLQHQTQKKKKKIFIGIIAVGAIIVAGAIFGIKGYLAKDDLYDTYIYGTWNNAYKLYLNNSPDYITSELVFNVDDSVRLKCELYLNDKYARSTESEGWVIDTDEINDEITYVEFNKNFTDDSLNHIYGSLDKYKNFLGYYIEVNVPKEKKFDLVVKDDRTNSVVIYRKDGTCHFCIDSKNCNNDDCGGTTLKYKRKGKYIYCYYNDNTWDRQAFILDDGIFYDAYIKDDE